MTWHPACTYKLNTLKLSMNWSPTQNKVIHRGVFRTRQEPKHDALKGLKSWYWSEGGFQLRPTSKETLKSRDIIGWEQTYGPKVFTLAFKFKSMKIWKRHISPTYVGLNWRKRSRFQETYITRKDGGFNKPYLKNIRPKNIQIGI